MKNLKVIFLLTVINIFIFSCKYDEGPAISLRSACKRVDGVWEISKFEVGGSDSTNAIKSKACYAPLHFKYKNDNKGTIDVGYGYYQYCATIGYWELKDRNKKITIEFSGSFVGIGPFRANNILLNGATYDIIKLKDDEMKIVTTVNNLHYKITLGK